MNTIKQNNPCETQTEIDAETKFIKLEAFIRRMLTLSRFLFKLLINIAKKLKKLMAIIGYPPNNEPTQQTV